MSSRDSQRDMELLGSQAWCVSVTLMGLSPGPVEELATPRGLSLGSQGLNGA